MSKKDYHIIWKGCVSGDVRKDEGDGWYTSDSYYTNDKCKSGVADLRFEELSSWYERMAVNYGEDGGNFHVYGGWRGSFNALRTGKTPFISIKEFHDLTVEVDAAWKMALKEESRRAYGGKWRWGD